MRKIFLIVKLLFIINFSLIHLLIATNIQMDIEEEKVNSHTHVPIQIMNEGKEEFYVFDVGQGNSQLVLYKEAKLGFLYDCGTSSKQKHPKIQALTKEDWSVFLTKKPLPKIDLKNMMKQYLLTEGAEEIVNKKERKVSEESISSGLQSISNKESDEIENLSNAIRSVIERASLDWLVIFLSHPDKDHISLVNQNTIPAGLKTLAFLGGDFLGKEDNTEVQKVLAVLKKRDNTWVEMPFYWNWNYDSYPKTYQDIRESFLGFFDVDPKIEETIRDLSLSQYNIEDFFHGSGLNLITKTNLKSKGFRKFIGCDDNEYLPLYKLIPLNEKSLITSNRLNIFERNVLIWAMNHRLYDVNAQSSVISFKLPENDLRLICTGDAEDSTFRRIQRELEKRSIIIPPKGIKRENILVVPHHGSQNNISTHMINLFNPTMFIISAGNGKQYGHPRLETIEWLRKQTGQTQFKLKYQKPQLIAFDEIIINQKKVKKSYLKNSIKTIGCPIFCTNVLGTIKFTEGDFSSLFKSFFDLEDHTYRVDFSKRAIVDDLEQVGDEDSCFYKKGVQYYYQVYNKKGKENSFYNMIEIEELNDKILNEY